MNIKIHPFVGVTSCYRCGKPILKAGLSLWSPSGSVHTSSRCICKDCQRLNRRKK